MRVSDFEGDERLGGVGGDRDGDGGGFDGGAVADANEAEDGGVAFGDAEDVVGEVGACRSCNNRKCVSACLSRPPATTISPPHVPLKGR